MRDNVINLKVYVLAKVDVFLAMYTISAQLSFLPYLLLLNGLDLNEYLGCFSQWGCCQDWVSCSEECCRVRILLLFDYLNLFNFINNIAIQHLG